MKQFIRVLAVSQLEVIIGLFLLSGLILYLFMAVLNNEGYLWQYFGTLHNELPIVEQYEVVGNEINSSDLGGNIAIFSFWAIVGLMVYYLVYYFFISERNLAEFLSLLSKRGADKTLLLEYAFAKVGIRVGATILLLIGLVTFLRVVLPYSLVTLNITANTSTIARLPEIIATAVMLLAAVHVVIILLRCMLLRQRIIL